MKITNQRLTDSIPALQRLLQLDPPVAASWALTKAVTKINQLLTPLNQLREAIVTENAVKGEDGQPVKPTDAEGKPVEGQVLITPEGVAKLRELFSQENEVEIEPVKIALFGDMKIKGADLLPVEWMLAD